MRLLLSAIVILSLMYALTDCALLKPMMYCAGSWR